MKTKAVSLTIVLCTWIASFGQSNYDVDINHYELPPAAEVNKHTGINITQYYSDFYIVGLAGESMIIKEIVHVNAKSSYAYSYKDQVILHYYSTEGKHKLKYSKKIWEQSRFKEAGKAVKSLYKLDYEELVPNTFIYKNNVYAVSKNFYSRYSDNPKLKAAPVSIIKENENGIDINKKLIYADVKDYAEYNITLSSDGSTLSSTCEAYLKKSDKKGNFSAIHIYDEDFNVSKYLPINSPYIIVENKLIRFIHSNKPGLTVEVNDIETQSTKMEKIVFDWLPKKESGLSSDFQVLSYQNDIIKILLAKECLNCNDKAEVFLIGLTIDLNPDKKNDFIDLQKEVPIRKLTESENSDQTELQHIYYKTTGEVDLESKSVGSKNFIIAQNSTLTPSSSIQYIKGRYVTNTPLLIYNLSDSNEISMYSVSRVMNQDNYRAHLPVIIEKNEEEVLLLSIFSVPTVEDNSIQFKSSGEQILEFSIVNLTDESIYRENLTGEINPQGKNERFYLYSGSFIQFDQEIFCLSKDNEGIWRLSSISW